MKTKSCPDCNGDGVIEKGTDDEQRCPRCGGSGFVPDDDDDNDVIRTQRDADRVADVAPRSHPYSDKFDLLRRLELLVKDIAYGAFENEPVRFTQWEAWQC